MTIEVIRAVKLGAESVSYIPVSEIVALHNPKTECVFKTREGYKYRCQSTDGKTSLTSCVYAISCDDRPLP